MRLQRRGRLSRSGIGGPSSRKRWATTELGRGPVPRTREPAPAQPVYRSGLSLAWGEDGMRIGSGTAAVIALALIAAGDVHGAGLGSDQAGKPAWPWRLTQQAEPSTPPAQPAAPLEQPAQEKAQDKAQENRSGAPSPPAAN